MKRQILIIALLMLGLLAGYAPAGDVALSAESGEDTLHIRVATFNVEDIRTGDLKNPRHPRLMRIAAMIQRIRPDIILINEIAYDQPGAPGYKAGDPEGQNGRRLAENFLAVSQGDGLEPLHFQAWMAPSNTGIASGFDLDNDLDTVTTVPEVPPSEPDGSPGRQTKEGRKYGNDCWGFGTFPGQYAMALLVSDRFDILEGDIRTFQMFPWRKMPGALLPVDPETGQPWYSEQEMEQFRLSSKSHWDVPVQLSNEFALHVLCSHPTPPAFDGEEQRNKKRNHDEIRFWADYINGENYMVDDSGRSGGMTGNPAFVLLGDLNADPDEGVSLNNPVQKCLLSNPRILGNFIPRSEIDYPKLDPDDTALWGLRVDYVLPSTGLSILKGEVERYSNPASEENMLSDHFPVWIDIAVPAQQE